MRSGLQGFAGTGGFGVCREPPGLLLCSLRAMHGAVSARAPRPAAACPDTSESLTEGRWSAPCSAGGSRNKDQQPEQSSPKGFISASEILLLVPPQGTARRA